MSCVTSLFSDLANLKIPKENLYLIQEQTIKSIEREWHSYSYENSLVDSQNIFNKNNFNTKIIIAKMIIKKKQVNFFHYEAELSEFLDHFIQEYS